MSFTSIVFVVFFAVVALIDRQLRGRQTLRNAWLLLASYAFYAAWDWRFLALIWISTVVDFGCSRALARTDDPRGRRLLLSLSLLSNLGILAFFKYFDFFAESTARLLAAFGLQADVPTLELILPLGISFYTFQTLGYTIDVYRRRVAPAKSLLDFGLYVAFFPQLVAGPIERAGALLPQIEADRRASLDDVSAGLLLALVGYIKKMAIADSLAPIVSMGFEHWVELNASAVAMLAVAFALQIYGDFSGYTDIARGSARMLGFRLRRNFDAPYLARSPNDFWRRWHISLSTWLRDYLYIPLGGNRHGEWKRSRNVMLTMVLGGLWHGAAWHFAVWGAYHGLLLVLSNLWTRFGPAGSDGFTWRTPLQIAGMFILTCIGWLIFRAETLEQMRGMLEILVVRPWGRPDAGLLSLWPLVGLVPLSALGFALLDGGASLLRREARRIPMAARAVVAVVLVYAVIFLGADDRVVFIYFQF